MPAPCRHQPAPACEWSDLRPTSKPTACLSLPRRCGPCRAAFPHLSQLQRKHRAAGLAVVGVSMEEDSPQLRAFVAQQVRQAAGVQLQWLVPVRLPPAWLSAEGRQHVRGAARDAAGRSLLSPPLPTSAHVCDVPAAGRQDGLCCGCGCCRPGCTPADGPRRRQRHPTRLHCRWVLDGGRAVPGAWC
jgi:hypothetical protein